MKKNTTIRISENSIQYYNDNYKTNHAGCVIACEGYPRLRDEALSNLKSWGIFRDEEINHLKEASKRVTIDKSNIASLKLWEAEIYDYYKRSDLDEDKFKIIIEKLRELPLMERFVLREHILGECL